ncbi:protein mobE [Duganella sp. FT135W]|uniref:Protein mobE n=1 Tax=Duganella flavida TaxID=2692175 RepID=A0A6L8K1Y1_9BURK|nr:DUF6753 family protein [Duganella flavida]MYM21473.1 protein mobE [Duganella flavida]
MNELDDSFAKLLGRQPTDAERQQIYQIRDALGLKNNDALWLVLMVLQYHQTMYARFPDLIKQAAINTLREFQKTADATLVSTKESAKLELARAVSATARDVARLTAAKHAAIWISACALSCCITFGAFGWYIHENAYAAGFAKGYGNAYLTVKDEKAAAAWANTPQGKAAYRLAQAGSIDSLIKCDQPGWKVVQGACYVHNLSDGTTYGWRIR